MNFFNVSSDGGLKKLDEYLLSRSYITGYQASKDDLAVHASLVKPPPSDLVNVSRWYNHIESLLRISGVSGEGCGVTIEGSAPATKEAIATPPVSDSKVARGTSTVSMSYSSTITDLSHIGGVTWDDSEGLLRTKDDISLVDPLPRDKRRRHITSGPGEASGSGAQPQPTSQASHARQGGTGRRRTIHECLDDMERMIKRQWRITLEYMYYMYDFNRVLAQRLPATSPSDEPFPPPPAFSYRPIEDYAEYDEDEEDDAEYDEDEEDDVEYDEYEEVDAEYDEYEEVELSGEDNES